MRQGTGSTNKWNLSCYNPRTQVILSGFRWSVHGGGARQRQHWHFIPLWIRAGRRWQIVWQGPRFGFVAETGRFVTTDAMSTISCPCALLPSSSLFSVLTRVCFSSSYSFVRTAVICSTPASACVLLVSFVVCHISEFLLFYSLYSFRV